VLLFDVVVFDVVVFDVVDIIYIKKLLQLCVPYLIAWLVSWSEYNYTS
jgi:hypothetical protein